VLRLDYISCVLTVASTILIGRRCWEGWALAGVNSVLICIIGLRTDQLGFIPANVFCMVMSAINLRAWRNSQPSEPPSDNDFSGTNLSESVGGPYLPVAESTQPIP
jgi:hypothetical protein